jgi:hypothetical protein
MPGNQERKLARDVREEIAIAGIRRALAGLRFGTVTVIVQDGVVVQVDRTERERIDYSRIEKVSDGAGI